MKSKPNPWRRVIAALFWFGVWELAAYRLNLPFAIPSVESTASALWGMLRTIPFWQTVLASLGRIAAGLLTGTALGVLLAALTIWSPLADAIVRPMQNVIRSTPVASFILLLWVLIGRDAVPTVIAVLMVMPVIWQALCDAYQTLDPTLNDVVRAFHATPLQRLILFVAPSLRPSFLTAFATSAGLAWKSGIAAEIIAYTAHSIGRSISDARNLFNGPEMMAWTVCVVILSMLCEKLISRVIGGFSHPSR